MSTVTVGIPDPATCAINPDPAPPITFPNFTGSGSPEGVVTSATGKFYQDTDTGVGKGGLYLKIIDGGNTGWFAVGSVRHGVDIGGFAFTMQQVKLLTDTAPGNNVTISDVDGQNGTGNGFYWDADSDGTQNVYIQLGSTGQFVTQMNADGTTNFPGSLIIPTIPTTDPAVAGELWSNLGIVTVSAG